MTNVDELAVKLDTVTQQLAKASDEIKAQIAILTDAVNAAGTLPPEADAALVKLSEVAQALDDLNPDVV